MSEVQELKKAILSENLDKAEKLLRAAKQTGAISPMMASQIETYLAMARWETTHDKDAMSRLKAIVATKL